MKPTRISAAVLLVLVALFAAACGSEDKTVPPDSVAVVDGTEVTKTELDALLARAKKTYVAQKRAFPKAGTAGVPVARRRRRSRSSSSARSTTTAPRTST